MPKRPSKRTVTRRKGTVVPQPPRTQRAQPTLTLSATFQKFLTASPAYYLAGFATSTNVPKFSALIRGQVRALVRGKWESTAINPREVLVAVADKADFEALRVAAGVAAGPPLSAFPRSLGHFSKVV